METKEEKKEYKINEYGSNFPKDSPNSTSDDVLYKEKTYATETATKTEKKLKTSNLLTIISFFCSIFFLLTVLVFSIAMIIANPDTSGNSWYFTMVSFVVGVFVKTPKLKYNKKKKN